MVYCGKPSKGCENCRLKRLKCDQKRPGCGQCRNTGRTCLGYRDISDLVFRDESHRVAIKFQKKSNIGVDGKPAIKDHALRVKRAASFSRDASVQTLVHIPVSIHQPVQEIAIAFLLGDYIRGSHFDYLPSMYDAVTTRDVLSTMIKAVGLSSLALQTGRLELQDEAQKLYIDAINYTNLALQCKEVARNDDVLVAILLLALYETLRHRNTVSVDVWTAHMQGALALVTLRGPSQFKSRYGLELFKQIAASIRVFCVQHGIRVPHQLRGLTHLAKPFAHPDDNSFELPCVVEAFTDLRADMAEGLLTSPLDIIERAEKVLQIIEELQLALPAECLYDTVPVQKASLSVWSDHYHKFEDHHVAQIWNTIWMAKLHLNTMIYDQSRKSLESSVNVDKCHEEIVLAAQNICASVPQWFLPPQNELHVPRTPAMGYFLIWPLFTAGSSSMISTSMRGYIIERLQFIADDLKLPQAQKAARMLAENDCVESWMHIYHVF